MIGNHIAIIDPSVGLERLKGACGIQELLDSEDGWLCPACDCRYDILWALAQTVDLEFADLTELRCETCPQTVNIMMNCLA